MSGIQKGIAVVGIALQSGKGAPAAQPTFAFGVTGGALPEPGVERERDSVTTGTRTSTGSYISRISPKVDIATLAYFQALGLLLYGATGSVVAAGGGPVFTHDYSVGSSLPYLTAFVKRDADQFFRIPDCLVAELGISWEENAPLKIAASLLGTNVEQMLAFTPETMEDGSDRFTPIGGTFALDVVGSDPIAASVRAGEFKISNKAAHFHASGSVLPSDIDHGNLDPEISLTVRPDDWALYLESVYDGSALREELVTGSFETNFVNGTNELNVSADEVPFGCDVPDIDPDGGKAEMAFAAAPEGANPIVFQLKNAVEDYTVPAPVC